MALSREKINSLNKDLDAEKETNRELRGNIGVLQDRISGLNRRIIEMEQNDRPETKSRSQSIEEVVARLKEINENREYEVKKGREMGHNPYKGYDWVLLVKNKEERIGNYGVKLDSERGPVVDLCDIMDAKDGNGICNRPFEIVDKESDPTNWQRLEEILMDLYFIPQTE